ncbi:MAG: ferredoxin [Pseudomonadota bacterium]
MARQVEIDQDECVGCESCVELCPEIFMMGPGGDKALVLRSELEPGQEACAAEAIDTCPVGCIAWS